MAERLRGVEGSSTRDVGLTRARWRGVVDGYALVMVTYLAAEYDMGMASQALIDFYNGYGAQGWQISTIEVSRYNQRRVVFMQGAPAEYLVVDYDTGKPIDELTDYFNSLGVDGWALSSVDLAKSNVRRAVFMKTQGGGNGTDPNAMHWVPYVGPPQTFAARDLTRDGAWTMVANKATSTRPAPQASGPEMDLLLDWIPQDLNARASYHVTNEWTMAQGGWINSYGIDVLTQNLGATHTIALNVNGIVRDTLTIMASVAMTYFQNITPLIVGPGAVVRVSLQVDQVSNDAMHWYEQQGLFSTPPVHTSLAQGAKDGGSMDDTAYGCHLMFVPGTASPDWDVVAHSGGAAGASEGGGIEEAPADDLTYGRMNATWNRAVAADNDIMDGGNF